MANKESEKRKKEYINKGGKKYYRYGGDDIWIEVEK